MRAVLTALTICLTLATLPARADRGSQNDLETDTPDFRQADVAFAYEVSAEAYAAFSVHFGRAHTYYIVGDFTGAIKELERAYLLVRDPSVLVNLALAYDTRAEVAVESGDYQKARVDKRMALHLYRNAAKTKLSKDDQTLCAKRIDGVHKELGRLREIDPVLAQLRKQQLQ